MIFKAVNYSLIFLLQGLRPLLGPSACRFSIGCTEYAIIQLKQENLVHAMINITKRLLSCNPFS